jgi:hypothetical protein
MKSPHTPAASYFPLPFWDAVTMCDTFNTHHSDPSLLSYQAYQAQSLACCFPLIGQYKHTLPLFNLFTDNLASDVNPLIHQQQGSTGTLTATNLMQLIIMDLLRNTQNC